MFLWLAERSNANFKRTENDLEKEIVWTLIGLLVFMA